MIFSEFRARINEHCRKQNEKIKEGKWRDAFNSVLEKMRQNTNWNVVEVDGERIVGQDAVDEQFTERFRKWHATPTNMEEKSSDYWRAVMGEWVGFKAATSNNIPEALKRKIWEAIRNSDHDPEKQTVNDLLEDELHPDRPPAFEEFLDQIKK